MSTDEQATADLRRDVRRLVEVATHAQLEAISTAWLCAAESQAAAWAEAFKEADIAAPGQWELRLTSAALPIAPATPSLKPGQRVAEVRAVMMQEVLLGTSWAKADDSRLVTVEGEPLWDVIARVAVALGARADGALESALHGPVRELGGP